MGGWVSGEKASVHYLAAEMFEPTLGWTSAQGDSGGRLFDDICELPAIGKF